MRLNIDRAAPRMRGVWMGLCREKTSTRSESCEGLLLPPSALVISPGERSHPFSFPWCSKLYYLHCLKESQKRLDLTIFSIFWFTRLFFIVWIWILLTPISNPSRSILAYFPAALLYYRYIRLPWDALYLMIEYIFILDPAHRTRALYDELLQRGSSSPRSPR